MPTSERGVDRGARLGRRAVTSVGTEIRDARVGAGLSLREVGRSVGLSSSQVGRIERAVHPSVSVAQLSRICGAVGLDLSLRTYPGGPPIRDAAHVALLGRCRSRLGVGLRMQLEVPIPIDGDQRAWDALIVGADGRTAVEAETRLGDVQALIRRIGLKQRDAGIDRVLLALANTRHNRSAVREADAVIREAFPVPARVALSALVSGRHPSGSAIVFL